MPKRSVYLMFDDFLKQEGIVRLRDFSIVHDWMDSYCGINNRNIYSEIDVDDVRAWVLEKSGSMDDALVTDFLRIAFGHLFLNLFSYGFVFADESEFMKRALEGYIARGYSNYSVLLCKSRQLK